MAGIGEFEAAFPVEDGKEQRGVAAEARVVAEKVINVVEHRGGILAEGHSGERALKHGGEKRRAQAFAGNVGNEKSGAIAVEPQDVKVVAPDGQARLIHARHLQVRKVLEFARQQRLLDFAGDAELLLHALPFALALHQPRVVEHARGFQRNSIESLPLEFRKCRRPAAVQIQHTEQLAANRRVSCLRRSRWRHGVERNDDDGAQTLRDDALGRLQIEVGVLHIFGDDARFVFQRLPDRRLAGFEAFERKPLRARLTGQADVQLARFILPQEQAAVGISERYGLIHHVFEDRMERQLRVQQRGSFQQKAQLAQTTGSGIGGGDVLDAGEQLGDRSLDRDAVKDELKGIFQAERDDIAIEEGAILDALSVDKEPAALAAVFNADLRVAKNQGRALPGNAPVGQLQMIAGVRSAADEEGKR